jgi:hypothetical protein
MQNGEQLWVVLNDDLIDELNIIFERVKSDHEVSKHKVIISAFCQISYKTLSQLALLFHFTFVHSCLETSRYYVVNVVSDHYRLRGKENRFLAIIRIFD